MKTCPHCKSNNIIMFDADNDLCKDCNKWFVAVSDKKKVFPVSMSEYRRLKVTGNGKYILVNPKTGEEEDA